MSKLFKLSAIFLSLTIILLSFASCSFNNTNRDGTTVPETETIVEKNIDGFENTEYNGIVYPIPKDMNAEATSQGVKLTSDNGKILIYTADKVEYFSWEDAENDLKNELLKFVSEAYGINAVDQSVSKSEFISNEYEFTSRKMYGTIDVLDENKEMYSVSYIGFYSLSDNNRAKFIIGLIDDSAAGTNYNYINDTMDSIMEGIHSAVTA